MYYVFFQIHINYVNFTWQCNQFSRSCTTIEGQTDMNRQSLKHPFLFYNITVIEIYTLIWSKSVWLAIYHFRTNVVSTDINHEIETLRLTWTLFSSTQVLSISFVIAQMGSEGNSFKMIDCSNWTGISYMSNHRYNL